MSAITLNHQSEEIKATQQLIHKGHNIPGTDATIIYILTTKLSLTEGNICAFLVALSEFVFHWSSIWPRLTQTY